MRRAQLRRLGHLEAQGRTYGKEGLTRWVDMVCELMIDTGEVEEEEIAGLFGLLDSYQRGNRTPTVVAAWARWEALLESNPELRKRTSFLLTWEWWRTWADLWQRA